MSFNIQKSLLGLIILLSATSAFSSEKYKTENVIVVVMDGPRYSETWGDSTHQYIPRMANDMAKHGIVYTNFRNNGPTYTCAGHTAITTGVYQKIANNGTQLPKNPSMFQYWIKHTGKSRRAAYVITSKDKLAVLTNCKDKDWKGQYRPFQDCGYNGLFSGYRPDRETHEHILNILKKEQPQLVLINYQQPDSWGHAGNWDKYLETTKASDEYIYQLFKFIQEDPFYKDKTTFIVTNDHGRHLDGHKDGFISHGDSCEGCRKINFFAYGPDFKKNVIFDNEREQIDIPVTIAEILGFSMPTAKGQVMDELFQN